MLFDDQSTLKVLKQESAKCAAAGIKCI